MNFTKIVKADLDSPRQELSSGGLRIAVALSDFPEIVFLSARIGRPMSNPAVRKS